MIKTKVAIVGAGLSGCVIAHQLAAKGISVEVFESRDHIGGNCFTQRDERTDVMVHKYGPHIFHTDKPHVWRFIQQFGEFKAYDHRVKATVKETVYSMPINLHTINQFFNKAFRPSEAKSFISALTQPIKNPKNFEEQALAFVGKALYEAFFKEYTIKQWGCSPIELPASILKRLPLRFNYDDRYFNHPWQAMPVNGYTPLFQEMLSDELIELNLNSSFEPGMASEFAHVFYSGPLDAWFGYEYGHLPYRTLDFHKEVHEGVEDYQGVAVMNYPDASIPYTRITEHKHFAPWEKSSKGTVIYKEVSRVCEESDIPYYPVRLNRGQKILEQYQALAKEVKNVTFIGRLGTFQYLDMDVTIDLALKEAEKYLEELGL